MDETTNVQIIILKNDEVLISAIEEVGAEIGDPNCKLTSPYKILGKHECRHAHAFVYSFYSLVLRKRFAAELFMEHYVSRFDTRK